MIFYSKISLTLAFAVLFVAACFNSKPSRYVIAYSKAYEASLFRQHCAVCHGPEADGKTLDDGKQVPSLRSGDFKFKTEAEMHKQIAEGGNGMLPFRDQLTEREINLMVGFVRNDLRK